MRPMTNFWAAFCTGLAAPAMLASPPATYPVYAGVQAVPAQFAAIGRTLSTYFAVSEDERPGKPATK